MGAISKCRGKVMSLLLLIELWESRPYKLRGHGKACKRR